MTKRTVPKNHYSNYIWLSWRIEFSLVTFRFLNWMVTFCFNGFVGSGSIVAVIIMVLILLNRIQIQSLNVIYQTRETVFHRDIQKPRIELKILRWRNSRCSDSRVYLSDRCCTWENLCGVHLTDFLPICHSYGRKVWFRVIRSDWQKLFLQYNIKLCRKFHTGKTENLPGELNATNIK